jgi:hypothetical protein
MSGSGAARHDPAGRPAGTAPRFAIPHRHAPMPKVEEDGVRMLADLALMLKRWGTAAMCSLVSLGAPSSSVSPSHDG